MFAFQFHKREPDARAKEPRLSLSRSNYETSDESDKEFDELLGSEEEEITEELESDEEDK